MAEDDIEVAAPTAKKVYKLKLQYIDNITTIYNQKLREDPKKNPKF